MFDEILIDFILFSYGFDIRNISIILCKSYHYLNNAFASLSPLLLVYISFERLMYIKYPARKFILRKTRNQLIYLMFIIVFNLIIYFPFLFYYNLIKLECDFTSEQSEILLNLIDCLYRVLMPSLSMIITTMLIIITIHKTRTKAIRNYSLSKNKLCKKDIKLAITSIFLNLFYIILTVPMPLLQLFSSNSNTFLFDLSYFLFYLSYSVNFLIVLLSNTLFRDEFFNMFVKEKQRVALVSLKKKRVRN